MANVNAMVQEGIAAIKAGRKADARKILEQAVDQDEHNEEAWLWLSACVESLQEQQICLENVLAINPGNTKAKKGLDAVVKQLDVPPAPTPAPFGGDFDPFSVTDPYADPTAAWGNKFDAPAATSVDWGRGSTPTPGSGKEVRTPSPEDLDNWMANLPIAGKPAPEKSPLLPSFDTSFDPSSGPFGVSDTPFDNGKDGFGASSNDMFGSSSGGPSPFDTPASKSVDPFDFGDTSLPPGFGAFDSFGASNTDASAGSGRGDRFGSSNDSSTGASRNSSFGGASSSNTSADRFKFGGGSSTQNTSPATDPFSLPKAEPISGRRKASELPGSSSLFRDKDDADEPEDMDDLAQLSGIFGGGSSSPALKSAKSTLGISSNNPAYRMIPAEIQADSKSGNPPTRTLLILGVLNVLSLIVLLLNLKG